MIKTICFHAFRSGVGKTHLIANTAIQLARHGLRVGIVDADMRTPGMHILFDLPLETQTHTLNHYLRGEARFDEIVHTVGKGFNPQYPLPVNPPGEVLLIPACGTAAAINLAWTEGYDLALLHDSFNRWIDEYQLRYLLVDTHPGLDEDYALLTAAKTDLLLIVARPDRQDMTGTGLLFRAVQRIRPNSKPALIINKLLNDFDRTWLYRHTGIEQSYTVAGELPMTMELAHLSSRGIFSAIYPDHPWSQAVNRIADFIMAQEGDSPQLQLA